MLGGVAGVQLIENLNSVIRYFHCKNETISPNVDGEREEGTAGNLTLSEADDRSGVGIGQKCKLEPIRCDTLGAESVKRFETRSVHEFCAASPLATGGLIHATSGSRGAAGGRCRNRIGLAA